MQVKEIKHYLESNRIILRDWKDGDLEHFARINRDPMIMRFYPSPLDEAASTSLVKHFQQHIDKNGYGFFAAEDKETGKFMGFAGIAKVPSRVPCSPAIEIAWRLDYEYWGKAYASEAAQLLINHAFDTLNVPELVAYCVTDNQRAEHILKKIGFSHDESSNFSYAPKRNAKAKNDYHLYRLAAKD